VKADHFSKLLDRKGNTHKIGKDTCGEGTNGKVRKQQEKLPQEVSVHQKP
jgi:hypothetical protein